MALREILAVFGVEFDGKQLEEGNKQVDKGIDGLKAFGAALAGAFAVGKVKDFVFGLADVADNINKSARRLNTNALELQAWQHGANLAGVSAELLEGALLRLSVSSFKAEEGGKELTEAFKKLGVEAANTDGTFKSSTQQFEEVGLALSKIENTTERVALATQLFGRGAARQLLSLFEKGAPSIKEFRAELEKLGGGFDQEFLDNSEAMNDNMTRLQLATTSLKVKIASFLLPIISQASIKFAHFIGSLSKTLKNTNLAQAGFVLLGVSGLAAVNKLLTFGQLSKIFLRWLLPLGLALIVLDEIITFAKGGDTVLGDMIDKGFGPGASAKVRAFFKAVGKEVSGFFSDLSEKPAKFEQDFHDMIDAMREDTKMGSGFWAEMVGIMLEMGLFFTDAVTGGWSNMTSKIGGLINSIAVMWAGMLNEAKNLTLEIVAEIADAFGGLWKAVFKNMSNQILLLSKVFEKGGKGTPLEFLGQTLRDIGTDIGALGSFASPEERRAITAREREAYATAFESESKGLRSGGNSRTNVVVNNTTNVNLPPGTSAQTATRAGNAAAKGSNRAAKAALGQKGKK